MLSYWQLLLLILPVFVLVALGATMRRVCRLTTEIEGGMLRLYVNLFYPALTLKSVLGNAALHQPGNIFWSPLVGFATVGLGFAVGYYAGRALGLRVGSGLRTFAFSVGIYNYGFIPIPLMELLYGREPLGVLLVHNMGCELAMWTVGLLVLAGMSLREGWHRIMNPTTCTLVVALAINLSGITLPAVLMQVIDMVGVCAIPFGLLLCGATLETFSARPRELFHGRTSFSACLLRLAVLPAAFLVLARIAPVSLELKRVIAVQAAMPAGMMPLVLARHYGGQPVIAAQIIVGTTLLGVLTIPLWLYFGLAWIGG